MSKFLYIGDPHLKPSNIEESHRLFEFILETCKNKQIDNLIILGDLYDTHAVVRLEVQQFWDRWLNLLSEESFKTTVLVGNHDLVGDYSNDYSSLHVFKSLEKLENRNLKIVTDPYKDGFFAYLPYIHDNIKFIEESNKLAGEGATILIAHPNLSGAIYDNGMDVMGLIDSNSLDVRFSTIVGGHYHTEKVNGRMWYVGTARWLTKSCANKKKGIWLVEHSDVNGSILCKEFISTEQVCTPIYSFTWEQDKPKPEFPAKGQINLELIGTSDWVQEQKTLLKGKVSLSSKITNIKKTKNRKSGKSLREFLTNHYQAEPEKKQKVINYLEGINLV